MGLRDLPPKCNRLLVLVEELAQELKDLGREQLQLYQCLPQLLEGLPQSATPIQLSDLQSILSNIQVPPGGEAIGAGSSGPSVDLSTALTGEALQPILSQEGFLDKVKAFLPAGEEEGKEVTAADLKGTVQSPQFQQAVSMFSMALQSGQIAPLVREFGLGDEAVAAATQGDMGAFVKALQKEKAGDGGDGKDAPEDMALD